MARPRRVYLTVDVEPDCPPYLWTWRGIEEGMPRLLDMMKAEGVGGTFFVTGDTAARHPGIVARTAADGHEIGCHGYSHASFRTFSEEEARDEISRTNDLLRPIAPVTSFRAPYLQFPERFMPILAAEGFRVDSSRAGYKLNESAAGSPVARLRASLPPSVLRLPGAIRDPWLRCLADPIVLFVHPWEFVDLTRAAIPLDCRFRTGRPALDDLRDVIRLFRRSGAEFAKVRDYRPVEASPPTEL